MPLTVPPQVRIVYAQANTPGPNTGNVPFDSFYDFGQADVTTEAAATLAALGLSYSAGTFTALMPIVIALDIELQIKASPGGACLVGLTTSDLLNDPQHPIAHPNTDGTVWWTWTYAMETGDVLRISKLSVSAPTNTPLTYVAMTIVRLI